MNFFIEMRESVINFKFYDEIRKSRYGKVFGYLALLLLIVYTLSGVRTYITTNTAINATIAYMNNDMPEFSLSNGTLDWKGEPLQYLLKENGTIVVVDINNALDDSFLDSQSTSYFVFRKESATMNTNSQNQVVTYKELGLNFTKADALNLLKNGNGLVIIFIVLFFPFYYGFKILNVVLLAVVASMACAVWRIKIRWKENFIISGFALTLPILLALLFNLAGFNFPGSIYWIISIVYVIMAIRIVRTTEFAAEAEAKRLAMESVIESSAEVHKTEDLKIEENKTEEIDNNNRKKPD